MTCPSQLVPQHERYCVTYSSLENPDSSALQRSHCLCSSNHLACQSPYLHLYNFHIMFSLLSAHMSPPHMASQIIPPRKALPALAAAGFLVPVRPALVARQILAPAEGVRVPGVRTGEEAEVVSGVFAAGRVRICEREGCTYLRSQRRWKSLGHAGQR